MELVYKSCVMSLQTDFRRNEIKLKAFAQPFDLGVEDCLDGFQMELIICRLIWKPRGNILKTVW